jgi:hypothetical protein
MHRTPYTAGERGASSADSSARGLPLRAGIREPGAQSPGYRPREAEVKRWPCAKPALGRLTWEIGVPAQHARTPTRNCSSLPGLELTSAPRRPSARVAPSGLSATSGPKRPGRCTASGPAWIGETLGHAGGRARRRAQHDPTVFPHPQPPGPRLRPGKHAADRARLPSRHPEVRYR